MATLSKDRPVAHSNLKGNVKYSSIQTGRVSQSWVQMCRFTWTVVQYSHSVSRTQKQCLYSGISCAVMLALQA